MAFSKYNTWALAVANCTKYNIRRNRKYIWSYLKKYPKWLMLDFFGAVFFVVVNLGLPTVLARMIDEGINRGDSNRLYYWAIVMLIVILLGVFGRIVLAYAAGKLTTSMVRDMRNDVYDKLQE